MKRLLLLLFILPFFALGQSKDADVELVHLLTKDTTLRTREGTIGYNYTTHKHYFIRNGGAKTWIPGPATSVTVPGSDTYLLYNSSGSLGASANLKYDATNNNFRVGTLTTTGVGTRTDNFFLGLSHTDFTSGAPNRWNMVIGEQHFLTNNVTATHIMNDNFILGSFYNKLEMLSSGGPVTVSGHIGGVNNIIQNENTSTSSITFAAIVGGGWKNKVQPMTALSGQRVIGNWAWGGSHNLSEGYGSGVMGYWGKSSGYHSLVHGFITTFVGDSWPGVDATFNIDSSPQHTGTVERVYASGRHAINFSANSPHQGSGKGATGDYSGIFAGVNGDVSGRNSVVLGGYEVTMADSATVAAPRLYSRGGNSLGITTVTTNTTINKWDYYTILVDATSGNITITLPAVSSSANVIFIIKKIDASANTVTIDPNASELIDGNTTEVIISQTDFRVVHCDTTAWWITGR